MIKFRTILILIPLISLLQTAVCKINLVIMPLSDLDVKPHEPWVGPVTEIAVAEKILLFNEIRLVSWLDFSSILQNLKDTKGSLFNEAMLIFNTGLTMKVDALLKGTYRLQDNSIEFMFKLIDIQSNGRETEFSVSGSLDHLSDLHNQITNRTLELLQVTLGFKDTFRFIQFIAAGRAYWMYCLGQYNFQNKSLEKAIYLYELARETESSMIQSYLGLAEVYFETGQFDRIEEIFNQKKELASQERGLKIRIKVALAQLDFGQAKNYLNQAMAKHPDKEEFYLLSGELFLKQKLYSQATAQFLKTIELNPLAMRTYELLAQAYLSDQDPKKAVLILMKALHLNPYSAKFHVQLGRAYYNLEKYHLAIQEFQETLLLDPENPEALYFLAAAYQKNGWFEMSMKIYKRLLEKFPQKVELYNNQAVILWKKGRTKDSRQTLKNALQIAPHHPALLNTLGFIAIEDGKYSEAINFLSRAVNLDPENTDLLFNLAEAHLKAKQFEAAQPYYESVVERAPDLILPRERLIQLLNTKKQWQASLQQYSVIASLNPSYPLLNAKIGALYEERGEISQAIEEYEKCLKLNPNDVNLLLKIGDLYLRSEGYRIAAIKYDQVLQSNNNHLRALKGQGIALFHSAYEARFRRNVDEETTQSESCLRNVLRINKEDSDTYYWLGKLYADLKQENKTAEFFFKSYLNAKTTDPIKQLEIKKWLTQKK